MATFHFELVSPERLVLSTEAEQVVVPGTEGEFTMMKDHAPLMAAMKPGVVVVTDARNARQSYFVRGGFADVSPSGLTILAEQAVPVEEVSEEMLASEIKAAEAEFESAADEDTRRVAQEKLSQLVTLRETQFRHT